MIKGIFLSGEGHTPPLDSSHLYLGRLISFVVNLTENDIPDSLIEAVRFLQNCAGAMHHLLSCSAQTKCFLDEVTGHLNDTISILNHNGSVEKDQLLEILKCIKMNRLADLKTSKVTKKCYIEKLEMVLECIKSRITNNSDENEG